MKKIGAVLFWLLVIVLVAAVVVLALRSPDGPTHWLAFFRTHGTDKYSRTS